MLHIKLNVKFHVISAFSHDLIVQLSRFEIAIASVISLPAAGQSSRSIGVGNACQRARDKRERAVVTCRSA